MVRILAFIKSKPLVVLGVIVGVILLIKFVTMKGGLFNIFVPTPLPNEGTVGVKLTKEQAKAVRELSLRLHADMVGVSFFSRDGEGWQMLMSMPDDMFVAVYNDFGNLFFREGNGTLRQWIEDESTWWDTDGIASKSQITSRMAMLNLM